MPQLSVRSTRVRVLGALLVAAVSVATASRPAAAGAPPPYRPPVDGPVVDGFRPPPTRYAPGNRGLEYRTAPGEPVIAAADGTVVFAGQVGGTLHVTLLHDDGLRTSYSWLATVGVGRGQRVRQGQVIGTSGDRLHFGVRAGDSYVDPAALLAAGPGRVRLVPLGDDPGPGPGGEARALRLLLAGRPRRLTSAAIAWARGHVAASVGATASELRAWTDAVVAVHPAVRLASVAAGLHRAVLAAGAPCTPSSDPPPPAAARGHVVVLVGGLGSSSEDAAIDGVATGALGVAPGDVVRFSYRGGRTPATGGSFPSLAANGYGPADTLGDLGTASDRLEELLHDLATAAPGRPIDVVAHSQGGVVARLAVARASPPVAHLITLGTPHQGADLATGVQLIRSTGRGALALEGVQAAARLPLEPGSPAIAQLAESSPVSSGAEVRGSAVPITSIGARGDLVVTAGHTALDGATNVIVPVGGLRAHDALPSSPEANREVALAIAGRPPTCEGMAGRVADLLTGEALGYSEDVAGLAVATAMAG